MDSTKLDFGMFLDDTTKKDSSCEPSKIEFPLYYDSEIGKFNRTLSFFDVVSTSDLFHNSFESEFDHAINLKKCEELGYGKYGYYKFNTQEDLEAVLEIHIEPPF